jgi:hypothetical protein
MVTTKKPTKKEMQSLVKALDDLLFYSRTHLQHGKTLIEGLSLSGTTTVTQAWLCSWGDLNAAIHRAEKMLEGRKDS